MKAITTTRTPNYRTRAKAHDNPARIYNDDELEEAARLLGLGSATFEDRHRAAGIIYAVEMGWRGADTLAMGYDGKNYVHVFARGCANDGPPQTYLGNVDWKVEQKGAGPLLLDATTDQAAHCCAELRRGGMEGRHTARPVARR